MLFQNPILLKPARLQGRAKNTWQKNLKKTPGCRNTCKKSFIVTLAWPGEIIKYANDSFYEILKFCGKELPVQNRCEIHSGYHFKTYTYVFQPG